MPEEQNFVLRGTREELMERIPQLLDLYQLLQGKNFGNIYGIPVTTFQDQFRFPPQVKLFFRTSTTNSLGEKKEVRSEISFRIMNETEKTMNPSKAIVLAQKIRREFAIGAPFNYQKGKVIVTYLDKSKGYDFRLRVRDETEGRRVINKVLDVQEHSPEWSRLVVHESKASFPDVPDRELIYGQNRRPPVRRPSALVPFRYAELHVWGYEEAVTLVDLTGTRSDVIVAA